MKRQRRCLVVGGGITGLAAAHRFLEMFPEGDGSRWSVELLEASDRLGGLIRTERVGPYLFDDGPDTLLAQKPAAVRLAGRLGLGEDLVPVAPRRASSEVVHRERLHPVPEGFMMLAPSRIWPVVTSPLFSIGGKLRMLREPWIPAAATCADHDESLASFVERRLGREVLERVAEPIVGGLFIARAEELSLRMAMPRFIEIERREGSLIRSLRRGAKRAARSGANGAGEQHHPVRSERGVDMDPHVGADRRLGAGSSAPFMALRGGLGNLVGELRRRLPPGTVRTGASVSRLSLDRRHDEWTYETDHGGGGTADAVVLACPAPAMARIVSELDPVLADRLLELDYASCATVTLAYPRSALRRPLRSYGFFVPRGSKIPLIACSYVSEKFPDRAPEDVVVLRAFVGGAHRSAPLAEDDAGLARIAHEALASLLELTGEPRVVRVNRFPQSMPQYRVGDASRIAWLRRRTADHPGLFLAGSAVGARGLPDCIQSGEEAAEQAAALFVERSEPLALSTVAEAPARLSEAGRTHDVPSPQA